MLLGLLPLLRNIIPQTFSKRAQSNLLCGHAWQQEDCWLHVPSAEAGASRHSSVTPKQSHDVCDPSAA